jgi:cell division protein FtsB
MRPRQLLLGAALVSALLAAAAFWDSGGLSHLRKLEGDVARQEAANAALRDENGRLSRRAKRLSAPGESQALEKAAREKLGYVRADEVLFKFE